MSLPKIAVLAGGISAEKEISKRSGANILSALQSCTYPCVLLDPADPHFSFQTLKNFDIIYPILHGQKGEDGAIQGILEWCDVPYIGCDVTSSALTMDKGLTKMIFQQIGIPCAKGFISNGNPIDTLNQIDQISYPVFIKPSNEGSSVGSHILHNKSEAQKILPDYLKQYPNCLIEEFLVGREMTVGILQNGSKYEVLPILELKPKAEFYDFNTKYTEGMTEFILPAPLEEDMLHMIHEQVQTICREFRLRDCVRIDLILTKSGPHYLEINTAPGMTATSDIPAMLKAAQFPLDKFFKILIQNAKDRHSASKI